MADFDDIKPTPPIYPGRRVDRYRKPKEPPTQRDENDEEQGSKRRDGDGEKGRNVDDYA